MVNFKIIATFKGTESYYGSYSETYINVEAPAPAATIEPEPAAPESEQLQTEQAAVEPTAAEQTAGATTEVPVISTEVAIITAVAVICIIYTVAFWAIRKRK